MVLDRELEERQAYCVLPLDVTQGYFILPIADSTGEVLSAQGHEFEATFEPIRKTYKNSSSSYSLRVSCGLGPHLVSTH